MKFKFWLENHEVEWKGKLFKHGQPVSFPYIRNPEKAISFGSTYQQDIEPHGKYLIHKDIDSPEGWETGEINFKNPYVLPFNTVHGNYYDDNSWKAELSRKFGYKVGKKLSQAIVDAGYDGIITISIGPDGKPYDTREIVDLRSWEKSTNN